MTAPHKGLKRPEDATDAMYEITARCLDCETEESWHVYEDAILDSRVGPDDAIENETEAARLWLSDHHENTHI